MIISHPNRILIMILIVYTQVHTKQISKAKTLEHVNNEKLLYCKKIIVKKKQKITHPVVTNGVGTVPRFTYFKRRTQIFQLLQA